MTDPAWARSAGIESSDGQKRYPEAPINALAVVVNFSDKVKTVTATYFDTLMFAAPVAGRGSVRDYYSEVSYGAVDIVTVNLPSALGWRRAPSTYAYYVNNNYCTDGVYPNNCQKLAEDIVDAINSVVDFSNYDSNSDGYMEPIMLIHSGRGAEFTGATTDIWSHSWSLRTARSYDGVTIQDYVIMPEYWQTVSAASSDMTIGVFVHEMGHGFWNLPDLYDRDYTSNGIGDWSLMAGGSWNGPNSGGWGTDGSSPAWPDAWSRVQMGYVPATDVTANVAGRSLPQAVGNAPPTETILRLDSASLASQEFFLLENRQKISGSYDEYLPGAGLFIWHVDEAMNSYSLQNDDECTSDPHCNCSDSAHFLVALEQADGLHHLESKTNQGDTGDPFPGSTTNRTWTNATHPESSSWYACGNTCIQATNISNSGATMTADLQIVCLLPVTTWLGNTTAWNTASNWSGGSVPTCGTNAIIPTNPSGGNFPTINANVEVAGLTIQTGAQVNMSANTLGVCGNMTAEGTGQFNGTGGTVTFKGSGSQTLTLATGANGQFYHLSIGTGGTSQTVTANSSLDVNGDLTIQAGATLSGGTNTIQVAGNWTDDRGSFARGSSTVVLDGATQAVRKRGASVELLNEGFDGATFPPTNWARYDVDSGGNQWARSTARYHTGSASALHLYTGNRTENGWLRTPLLALGSGAVLRFWENVDWASSYVEHSLWVCSTSCTTPPTNYTQVATFPNPVEDTWVERTVDLAAYAGQSVYLAYRYYGRNADSWYIDDVRVTAAGAWDGALAFYNLTVTGSGVATFQGDVGIDNNLWVGNGATMDVGTHTITGVGGTATNNGALRQTRSTPSATTTSFLTFGPNKYYGLDIYPTSGDMGATTVTVYGNQACSGLSTAVQRCFEITPETVQTADVTFYYRDAEENSQNAANAYHYDGAFWDELAFDTRPERRGEQLGQGLRRECLFALRAGQ